MYPYDFKDLVRKKVKSTSEYARGREYFVFSTDTTISTTVSTKPVIQQTFKSKRKISIEKIHFFLVTLIHFALHTEFKLF